jgi:hypothetical protein
MKLSRKKKIVTKLRIRFLRHNAVKFAILNMLILASGVYIFGVMNNLIFTIAFMGMAIAIIVQPKNFKNVYYLSENSDCPKSSSGSSSQNSIITSSTCSFHPSNVYYSNRD